MGFYRSNGYQILCKPISKKKKKKHTPRKEPRHTIWKNEWKKTVINNGSFCCASRWISFLIALLIWCHFLFSLSVPLVFILSFVCLFFLFLCCEFSAAYRISFRMIDTGPKQSKRKKTRLRFLSFAEII